MKIVVQILKGQKINLTILLIALSTSNATSQTNPWENTSKENPWVKTSEKENSVTTSSPKIDSIDIVNPVDSLMTSTLDSISTTIQTNVSTQKSIEPIVLTDNNDSYYFLNGVKQKVNYEYKAPTAFIGSFITGGFFLMFAIPVNMLTSVIPTPRVEKYVTNYLNENPKASKEEIKAVKKGIQKKRSTNSLGGSLAGMATGITVWLTAIFSI